MPGGSCWVRASNQLIHERLTTGLTILVFTTSNDQGLLKITLKKQGIGARIKQGLYPNAPNCTYSRIQ